MISGFKGGLATEIAKNLVLSGIGRITIHDHDRFADWNDLAANFFLTPDHVISQIYRPSAVVGSLAELNNYADIQVLPREALDKDIISKHDIVILIGADEDNQFQLANWVREQNKKIIICGSRGLAGYIFNDFGNDFVVVDSDGENPIEIHVGNVSKDEEGIVNCIGESRHGLQDGDLVKFNGIRGMTELNGNTYKVTTVGPFAFSIGDTTDFGDYEGGGTAIQQKQPKQMKFKSLFESRSNPQFLTTDWAKPDRSDKLHLAFRAVEKHPQLSFEDFMTVLRQVEDEVPDLPKASEDFDFCKTFHSFTPNIQLSPISSFLGGVIAQEAIKAITGKFTPIDQWLYYDLLECSQLISQNLSSFEDEDQSLMIEGRAEGQKQIFGTKVQDTLANLKIFVVGMGVR